MEEDSSRLSLRTDGIRPKARKAVNVRLADSEPNKLYRPYASKTLGSQITPREGCAGNLHDSGQKEDP